MLEGSDMSKVLDVMWRACCLHMFDTLHSATDWVVHASLFKASPATCCGQSDMHYTHLLHGGTANTSCETRAVQHAFAFYLHENSALPQRC